MKAIRLILENPYDKSKTKWSVQNSIFSYIEILDRLLKKLLHQGGKRCRSKKHTMRKLHSTKVYF
jgi:hypothetical protein